MPGKNMRVAAAILSHGMGTQTGAVVEYLWVTHEFLSRKELVL